MPAVPPPRKVIGRVVERVKNGVVHNVVVNESAGTWGQAACGLWFTNHKRVKQMATGSFLGSATKRSATCLECMARE